MGLRGLRGVQLLKHEFKELNVHFNCVKLSLMVLNLASDQKPDNLTEVEWKDILYTVHN